MLYFLSPSDNPYYNLALEEYLLKHSKEEILLCYVNQPSVVLGRFQVPYDELDVKLVYEKEINIVRRPSGGGTVYHDLGNLNYSYISNCSDQTEDYYQLYNQKTLDVLANLGLEDLSFQRNNIFCSSKKISGVAQYRRGKRIVHHGTLLVNADLEQLRAIFTKKDYYQSKGVKSVSSSVSNIDSFIAVTISEALEAFASSCVAQFASALDDAAISKMASDYSTIDWVLGRSPKYALDHHGLEIEVEKGKIVAINDERHLQLIDVWHNYANLASLVANPSDFF